MSAQPTFSLPPLNSPRCFRILQLHGARDNQSPKHLLHCTIRESSLDQVPRYEALSYRWDPPEESTAHVIMCNGQPVHIGPNLYYAMRQFRLPTGFRYLWIDQLCINQQSSEKMSQIVLMHEIYSKADRVLMWLGAAADDSDTAMRCFPLLVDRVRTRAQQNLEWNLYKDLTGGQSTWLEDIASREVVSIKQLFRRPWFGRLWTVQEAALASKGSLICCGGRYFSYALLDNFIEQFQYDTTGAWSRTTLLVDTQFFHARIIRRLRKSTNEVQTQASTLQLLDNTRLLASTEACDKLFAIGRFLPDDLMRRLVKIGAVDVPRLYIEVALHEIEQGNGSELIACAGLSQRLPAPSLLCSLPSWVPDWTFDDNITRLSSINRLNVNAIDKTLYNASNKKSKADIQLKTANDVSQIQLGCRILSNITECLSPLLLSESRMSSQSLTESLKSYERIDAYLQLCLALAKGRCQNGPYGQDVNAACYHALMAGITMITKDLQPTGALTKAQDEEVREDVQIARTTLGYMLEVDAVRTRLGELDTENMTAEHWELFTKYESATNNVKSLLDKHQSKAFDAFNSIRSNCNGRLFFVTNNKYVGIGPSMVREGDQICIIPGCVTPMLVRPQGHDHVLIGECYVHGIMQGELLKHGDDDFFGDSITLV